MSAERAKLVPLGGRAKLATAGLFAIGVVHLIAAGASIWLLRLIARNEAGEQVSMDEINSVVELSDQLGVAYWIGLAVAATTFLIWFGRAYANLAAFSGLSSGSTWTAIVSWFIPIANLFLPYRVTMEIWTGSARDPQGADPSRGSEIIKVWWAAWLLTAFAGMVLLREPAAPVSMEELKLLQYKAIGVNLGRVLAAVLAALVVKRITARQGEALAAARVVDRDAPAEP